MADLSPADVEWAEARNQMARTAQRAKERRAAAPDYPDTPEQVAEQQAVTAALSGPQWEAIMSDSKTIEIRGVWLTKRPAHLGDDIEVIVELADGTLKAAITERSNGGPISHYVHPAGILNSPDRTFSG